MHRWILTGLLGLMLAFVGPAKTFAALVSSQISGQITYVDSAWAGDVGIGDPVSGSVIYDMSLVPTDRFFALALDSHADFGITLNFGSYSFTTADDQDFGYGYPQALFTNGVLTGIDFVVPLAEGGMVAVYDQFSVDNASGINMLEGSLAFLAPGSVPPPVVIPLPAAGWLLFSGLLGLIAASRKATGTRHA